MTSAQKMCIDTYNYVYLVTRHLFRAHIADKISTLLGCYQTDGQIDNDRPKKRHDIVS